MKVPIPSDWDGVSWCEYGICWPDSEQWRSILRGFVTTPMRGRYWDERTGNLEEIQETGKQIWLDNIPLREVIMSCTTGTEIAAALQEIASALSINNCCVSGGSITLGGTGLGGSGLVGEEPSQIDDSDRQGSPPEGFDTWEEWDANKCNAVAYVLDQWTADITRAQNVNFVATILMPALLKLLAITILSPIPGDEVVIMAGMIIIALQQGILDPALDAMAGALTSRRTDLLCALYRASTLPAARSAAESIFQDEYTTLDAPTNFVATSLTGNWLNDDNLNRIFELNPDINYPTEDCSECPSALSITVEADPVYPAQNISYTGTAEAPTSGYNVIRVTATRTDGTHYRTVVRTDGAEICIWMAYAIVDAYLPQGFIEGANCNNDYIQPVPEVARNCWKLLLQSQTEETYVFDVCLAQSEGAVNDWIATL